MKYLDSGVTVPPLFPGYELLEKATVEDDVDEEDLRASICKACSETSTKALEMLRTEVWNEIPETFDLGSWDEVKHQELETAWTVPYSSAQPFRLN